MLIIFLYIVITLCINMQYFQVTTKDGYILSIQRIPEGRSEVKSNVTKKKEPVIVQHGVLVVSESNASTFYPIPISIFIFSRKKSS